MLDDLDDLHDTSAFLDELEEEDAAPAPAPPPRRSRRSHGSRSFLGMTPSQLFIIALELFMIVCILGFFLMIVTEKMTLPI